MQTIGAASRLTAKNTDDYSQNEKNQTACTERYGASRFLALYFFGFCFFQSQKANFFRSKRYFGQLRALVERVQPITFVICGNIHAVPKRCVCTFFQTCSRTRRERFPVRKLSVPNVPVVRTPYVSTRCLPQFAPVCRQREERRIRNRPTNTAPRDTYKSRRRTAVRTSRFSKTAATNGKFKPHGSVDKKKLFRETMQSAVFCLTSKTKFCSCFLAITATV